MKRKLLTGIIVILLITGWTLINARCKNKDDNNGGSDTTQVNPPLYPSTFSYIIQKAYPHDTSSFTQGLVIYNGEMYEGTGNYGRSKLLKVNLATGQAEKQISLDSKYFGEGITILRDTIYQLTWKEHVVLVYTLKDFKKVKELPIATEGWGITTDGNYLIVSDGSSDLYFYQPSDFKLVKKITVTDSGAPGYNINELEYIGGYIYANQWQLEYLLKIDPNSGKVVAKADLDEIWKRIRAKDPDADVLNGIAYDSTTNKVYITGKRWPELYEVSFQ